MKKDSIQTRKRKQKGSGSSKKGGVSSSKISNLKSSSVTSVKTRHIASLPASKAMPVSNSRSADSASFSSRYSNSNSVYESMQKEATKETNPTSSACLATSSKAVLSSTLSDMSSSEAFTSSVLSPDSGIGNNPFVTAACASVSKKHQSHLKSNTICYKNDSEQNPKPYSVDQFQASSGSGESDVQQSSLLQTNKDFNSYYRSMNTEQLKQCLYNSKNDIAAYNGYNGLAALYRATDPGIAVQAAPSTHQSSIYNQLPLPTSPMAAYTSSLHAQPHFSSIKQEPKVK